MTTWQVIEGSALAALQAMPEASVDCVVTSPPYWRMRDYGHPDQLGLEPTVEAFVDALCDVFDEVRRVLHPAGTCWVNLGDGYCRGGGGRTTGTEMGRRYLGTPGRESPGLKHGDLVGAPWAFAFEVRRRGWYLRGEQIWAKSNAQPDGSRSRPGRSHEHVFLLTKSPSPLYTYNEEAVLTPLAPKTLSIKPGTKRTSIGNDPSGNVKAAKYSREHRHRVDENGDPMGASLRSVWSIASNPNREKIQHFAMMPGLLARVCILAGSNEGDTVLDPFAGAATVGLESLRLGRSFVGIELVPEFATLARERLRDDAPLLAGSREVAC